MVKSDNSSENKAMIRQMNSRPVEANNNSNYNKKKHRILSKVISAVVTLLLISGVGYEAYKNFNEKAAGVSYDTNKSEENVNKEYSFRNEDLLNQHYDNHGHKTGESRPGLFSGANHYDNHGHKTGHSNRGMFGDWKHYDD